MFQKQRSGGEMMYKIQSYCSPAFFFYSGVLQSTTVPVHPISAVCCMPRAFLSHYDRQAKSSRGATHSRSEHPDPNFFLPPPLRGLWRIRHTPPLPPPNNQLSYVQKDHRHPIINNADTTINYSRLGLKEGNQQESKVIKGSTYLTDFTCYISNGSL